MIDQETKEYFERKFKQIDQRFERMDKRLEKVEGDMVNKDYLNGILDERLKPLATKTDVEDAVEKLAIRVNKGFTHMQEQIDELKSLRRWQPLSS